MVGIVIVSHSEKLAEGVVELAKLMAPEAPVVAAGGLGRDVCGTSFERIEAAVRSVDAGEGVAILADMGGALLTAEAVIEAMESEGRDARLLDAPIAEGAVFAAVESRMGKSLDAIAARMKELRDMHKLPEN